MRRCMAPRCRGHAMYEVDVDPTPRTTPESLCDLAPWLKLGHWELCRWHAARLATKISASPTSELLEYNIEHDPRFA